MPEEKEDGQNAPDKPWVEKIEQPPKRGRGRPPTPRPQIDLSSVLTVETDVAEHRAAIQQRFQAMLDQLAGGKAATSEENSQIATAVNQLAAAYGMRLTANGEIVVMRWKRGVYEARSMETTSRNTALSSSAFPKLTCMLKTHLADQAPDGLGEDPSPPNGPQRKGRGV